MQIYTRSRGTAAGGRRGNARLIARLAPRRPDRGLIAAAVVAGLAGPGTAAARDALPPIPLPPVRPAELKQKPAVLPAAPAPATALPPTTGATPPPVPDAAAGEVAACDALLAVGTLKAERLPPVVGAGGCGVAVPVRLSAIRLDARSEVTMVPPVTLRCAMAGAVADWIKLDLAPLLAARGGLARLTGLGGYECRGRNRVAGARMSEHALGNAIDIGAFVLGDGRSAKITEVVRDAALFAQVKLTTCARFSTVLGPGSDGFHEDNLHLDIEARRGGRHLCHWQLP